MLKEIRVAVRTLLRTPTFSLMAVATLTFGIAVNALMFGVFDAVVLRAVPFPEANQLYQLWSTFPEAETMESALSAPEILDIEKSATSFEGPAQYRLGSGVTMTGTTEPQYLTDVRISPHFFTLLRVQPILGRSFLKEEAEPGKGQVVLLSESLWKRAFASDQAVVGKIIRLDNSPHTIVGVMPHGYVLPRTSADIWIPEPSSSVRATLRNMRDTSAIIRLPKNNPHGLDAAQEELEIIASNLARDYPASNEGRRFKLVSLSDQLVGPYRKIIYFFQGVVGIVILLVCSNLANLLLARNLSRVREFSTRITLGASRFQIIKLVWMESLLLSFAGGVLALALLFWAVPVLRTVAPSQLPRMDTVTIDFFMLAYVLLITVATGFFCGVVPAIKMSKTDVMASLRDGPVTSSAMARGIPRFSLQGLFVTSQVAMAVVLSIAAALSLQSLYRLLNVPLGFDPENLLVVRLSQTSFAAAGNMDPSVYNQLILDQVHTIPGVESAALVTILPLEGLGFQTEIRFEKEQRERDPNPRIHFQVVSENYFPVMKTPILKGRTFTLQDSQGAPRVAIINEALSRRYFADQDPVGQRIAIAGVWSEIVGVAADMREIQLESGAVPEVYASHLQFPQPSGGMVVRTTVPPLSVGSIVAERIWSVHAKQRILRIATMEQTLSRSVAKPRLLAGLMGIFAGLALFLATLGIYGVVSYSTSRRTKEIGIRMALGAKRHDILRLVIGQGMIPVVAGMAIGLFTARFMSGMLTGLLFEVKPTDLLTFGIVTVTLGIAAFAACSFPARHAVAVEPAVALRNE